jgi:hypothetical protein
LETNTAKTLTSAVAEITNLMNKLRTSSAITSSKESSVKSKNDNKGTESSRSRSLEINHRFCYSEKATSANTKSEKDSTSLDQKQSYEDKKERRSWSPDCQRSSYSQSHRHSWNNSPTNFRYSSRSLSMDSHSDYYSTYNKKPPDRNFDYIERQQTPPEEIKSSHPIIPGLNCSPNFKLGHNFCKKCVTDSHEEPHCTKYYHWNPDKCQNCQQGYHFRNHCQEAKQKLTLDKSQNPMFDPKGLSIEHISAHNFVHINHMQINKPLRKNYDKLTPVYCACPTQVNEEIQKSILPQNISKSNDYPDLDKSEPEILQKFVQEVVHPPRNSPMDTYLDKTIEFIKTKQKQSAAETRLNNILSGNTLYFVTISFPPFTEQIHALVDTGASNSCLHESVAKRIKAGITPTNLSICTATGSDKNAVCGTTHLNFKMTHDKPFSVNFCSHFIVLKKLNNMQAILGADILLDSTKVHSISPTTLQVIQDNKKICIPLQTLESSKANGMSSLNEEITLDNTKPRKILKEDFEHEANTIDHSEKSTELYMSHNIDYKMQSETLPPSDVLFDMMTELEIESSKNNAKITDKNFKDCPTEYKPKLQTFE